ncbi:hypothetical protein SEA_ZOOMAN_201 [Microbacterium phage Zooman]|nr:hypothetical protein SEA_ZOOMAN_201 [Microbacterium phage Zooman]
MTVSSQVDALAARIAAEFVAVRGEFGVSGSTVTYSGDVPAGSTTATIPHNLGTRSVVVEVYDKSADPWVRVDVDVSIPSDGNSLILGFAVAPTAGQYRVVVTSAGGAPVGGGDVTSVAGRTGAVTLTKTDVGLSNVNNTSDAEKPLSNATLSELATKADASSVVPNTRKVAGKALSADVTISKSDVGLSNVDNTSDANKPLSTAAQTALNAKADSSDVVPNTRTVAGKPLSSNVTLAKSDVGLANVDNTSDANKPISSATQTALTAKANAADVVPNTRTVAGKPLSANVTLAKGDVGLSNVDNTSDANKPISSAAQSAIDSVSTGLDRTTVADGTNRVPNAFLKDVNPNNGLPAGWARNGLATSSTLADISAYPGTAWKLDGTGAQVGVYSPFFDVVPGETYNYTATIRGALTGTPTAAFRVEYRDAANGVVTQFAANAVLPGSAISADVSFIVTIPDKAVKARIYILHGATGTAGSWYVGNIGFRRTAESLLTPGSYLTDANLKGTYLVYRIKSGSSYPARIPGAVNVFIGDTDPGLAMAENDYWANPSATTIAAVAAAILDTGSDIRKAIQNDSIYIPASDLWAEDGNTATPTILGTSPNQRFARVLPNNVVSRLFSGAKIPNTWNTIRVRPHWQHTTSSAVSGDVAWLFTVTSSPHTAGTTSGTFYTDNSAQNVVSPNRSGAFALPLGGIYSIMIARNGTAGGDTFEYPIQLLGIEIIKES